MKNLKNNPNLAYAVAAYLEEKYPATGYEYYEKCAEDWLKHINEHIDYKTLCAAVWAYGFFDENASEELIIAAKTFLFSDMSPLKTWAIADEICRIAEEENLW